MRVGSLWTHCATISALLTTAFALPGPTGTRTKSESVEGEVFTNGERLAGGLRGLLKPKRLFDPTAPRPLVPRASSITVPSDAIQIAAGPPTGPTVKKRDGNLGGFSVDSEGYLTYTTDSSDFAAFEFTDDSKMALQWVSTISSADLTLGQVYPIYAMASGDIYYVKAGTPPTDAITQIFSTKRYDGDLNPVLLVPGGSTSQQFQWISEPNGDIILATDAATASATTGNQDSVLLVQYFAYGSTPSISAAQASFAQGTLLVNPLYLYARDPTGRFGGWLGDRGFDNFFPYYDVSLRTTFYAPALGSSSIVQLYYVDTDSFGQPRTWALTESSPSIGAYVIEAEVSSGSNTTGIANFNIPSSLSGLVTASTPASAASPFYGHNNGDQFLRTCDTPAHCSVLPGLLSLCVEVVQITGQPTVCDLEARQNFFSKYYAKSSLHVFDPSAPDGPTTGYLGFDTSVMYSANVEIYPTPDAGSYVYLDSAVQGQPTQHLYSLSDRSVYYTYGVGANQVFVGQLEYGGSFSPVQTAFNLPADPQKGGGSIITVVPPAYPGTSDKSWQFYVGTFNGAQILLSCADTSCPGIGATAVRPLCLEIVPYGWNPTACAAAWAAGQTFNPYN